MSLLSKIATEKINVFDLRSKMAFMVQPIEWRPKITDKIFIDHQKNYLKLQARKSRFPQGVHTGEDMNYRMASLKFLIFKSTTIYKILCTTTQPMDFLRKL